MSSGLHLTRTFLPRRSLHVISIIPYKGCTLFQSYLIRGGGGGGGGGGATRFFPFFSDFGNSKGGIGKNRHKSEKTKNDPIIPAVVCSYTLKCYIFITLIYY